MALLTTTAVRQHIETDLIDAALQRIIDDADAEIIRRLGELASQVEVSDGGTLMLYLMRKASSITSIVEKIDETNYTLATTDYSLLGDGYRIQRLSLGTYPSYAWRGIVTVTYVPSDDTSSRVRLLLDLVRLSLAYTGRQQESAGDASATALQDYQRQREALFNSLGMSGRRFLV